MKNRIRMPSLSPLLGLGTAIMVAVGAGGCGTSGQKPTAKAPDGSPVVSAGTVQATPEADAVQRCRAALHMIQSAKGNWALDNRKQDTEVPTDADLFGPGRYWAEKPKCPSGGTYTIGPVKDPPRCSIAGHVY